jgi:hypothetical protein
VSAAGFGHRSKTCQAIAEHVGARRQVGTGPLGVSDDLDPPLDAGEAAFLGGVGRRRRMKAVKRAEPRMGLC